MAKLERTYTLTLNEDEVRLIKEIMYRRIIGGGKWREVSSSISEALDSVELDSWEINFDESKSMLRFAD